MNRALLYLALRTRRNRLRAFLASLRRPKKAIGVLVWLGLLGFFAYAQVRARAHGAPGTRPETVFAVLAFILVASILNGVVQRGLAFLPSDVDFLFAGPFSRRGLVLYRILTLYPVSLVSGAVLFFFLGIRAGSLPLGLAGVILGHLSALHLQTAVALLAVHVSDRYFAPLRRGVQILLASLGAVVVLLLVVGTASRGGPGRLLAAVAESPAARLLLYPASAASHLLAAPGFREGAATLAGLLAFAGGTFLFALSLDVRFYEASLATSARLASLLSRTRRGLPAAMPSDAAPGRSLPLPRLPLFRGAGAVFWKNLVAVKRSGRLLFTGFCFSLLMALPGVFAARRGPAAAAAVGPIALGLVGMLPFMMQPYLAFDFRRDADHLAELKTLPVSPLALAAAQVAAPALLALLFQGFLLGLLAALGVVGWGPCAVAAAAFPATTVGCLASANLAFLLFPSRAPVEGGRPNPGVGFALSFLALAVSLVPAGGVLYLFLRAETDPRVAFGAAALAQYAVDLFLLAGVGEIFRRLDPATEVR